MKRYISLLVAVLYLAPWHSLLAAPLMYSGQLARTDGHALEWPSLRFSTLDADGRVLWSTRVDADVLAATDTMGQGQFVAVLDHGVFADGREGPATEAIRHDAHSLSVAVCHALPCLDPIPLGEPQALNAVPYAVHASHAAGVEPAAVRSVVYQLDDMVVSQDPGPGEFATLGQALDALRDRLLPPGRDVTIHIERGVYVHDAPIHFARPDGHRLRINGAGTDTTILRFPESGGLWIEPGAFLGSIDNLTIDGGRALDDEGEVEHRGVHVRESAFARLGRGMTVRGFPTSCVTATGGRVLAPGIAIRDCNGAGLFSRQGGVIVADDSRISHTDGAAVLAYDFATIQCRRCDLSNGREAVRAGNFAHVVVDEVSATDSFSRATLEAWHLGSVFARHWGGPREPAAADDSSVIRF